jgi:hypothetical protein
MLLKYVPDMLVLREIAFQTVSTGITRALYSNSNNLWPSFHLNHAIYTMLNIKHAMKEEKQMGAFGCFLLILKDMIQKI